MIEIGARLQTPTSFIHYTTWYADMRRLSYFWDQNVMLHFMFSFVHPEADYLMVLELSFFIKKWA